MDEMQQHWQQQQQQTTQATADSLEGTAGSSSGGDGASSSSSSGPGPGSLQLLQWHQQVAGAALQLQGSVVLARRDGAAAAAGLPQHLGQALPPSPAPLQLVSLVPATALFTLVAGPSPSREDAAAAQHGGAAQGIAPGCWGVSDFEEGVEEDLRAQGELMALLGQAT
jgi:hypothetical protein